MFDLNDVNTIEQDNDASPLQHAISLQRAINQGLWSLQGSYGRAMMGAIEAGQCCLGRVDAYDYWGNHIPHRGQVQPGTKGSIEYVAERMGEEWATAMAAV